MQNLNIPGNRNSITNTATSSTKSDSSSNLKNHNNISLKTISHPTTPQNNINSISKPVSNVSTPKPSSNSVKNSTFATQKSTTNQLMKICVVIGKKHYVDIQIFHDETSRDILDLISAQKSLEPKSTQVIYEELPKLQMLRIFEDHESIYEAAKVWLTNSKNTLRYAFKENKYRFLNFPEDYLIPRNVINAQTSINSLRVKIINDFFPMNGEKGKPLEFSSILYVKEKNRKKWTKKLVLIKSDGVFMAKSDYKKALSEKNPTYIRLSHISDSHLYYGYGWSKKLKSPTDFGFALKNPIIQTKNKNISYFCCETEELFNRWVAVVRTVKYGSILRHNFKYVSNENGKDRIYQIKEGHDRRLHPEKYKSKNSSNIPSSPTFSQNSLNYGTSSSNLNSPNRYTHQNNNNRHQSGASSVQSQAYLAGQAYARKLQNQQQKQQFSAPMTQFYEQGQSRNIGAVNDFPPPPPFVHQLENVFQNAKENNNTIQENRINHPSSGSRNSYNSDIQGQIGLNSQQNAKVMNPDGFQLNSTLTRKASAKLIEDFEDEFDSEDDTFENKLDAMGTLDSSVFNPGTVLRQTSYREEKNLRQAPPAADFQTELARKLESTLKRTHAAPTVNSIKKDVFPPPPPFDPPPVPNQHIPHLSSPQQQPQFSNSNNNQFSSQHFSTNNVSSNKPPPPPRRR